MKDFPEVIEMEKKLISALMLKEGKVIPQVTEIVSADDFYREEHRIIYRAIVKIYDGGNIPDVLLIEDELKRTKELVKINRKYLFSLIDYEFTTARAERYAHLIREMAQRRELKRLGEELAYKAGEEDITIEELLGEADKISQTVMNQNAGNIEEASSVVIESYQRYRRRRESGGGLLGTTTGLFGLDSVTFGLQKSDLLILAARPGMGKTALALNIALAASRRVPVMFFSLEMSTVQISDRILSQISQVSVSKIRKGTATDAEEAAMIQALEYLDKRQLYFDDTSALSIFELRMRAKRQKQKHGLGLIIIDYIQLMLSGSKNHDNRVQEVSEISRGLKALAKELDIPILALSQLNRNLEMRADKRPQLSDLRDSGSIEQDADMVMFLYRDEYYNREDADNQNVAELILAKNRNGATAIIPLRFEKECLLFSDLTREA